ncbi:MAG: (2Fe-2S)-binding protein [Acidobacteria bacterium]|nr:(2Fe-2S)-binding protein [Acidobacteriota bacterium]
MSLTRVAQSLPLEFRLNGRHVALEVKPHETLLEVLRERVGLTGTKLSCDMQVCGACTVLLDGLPVSSCTSLAFEARGKEVLTIEGLSDGRKLHPLQEAFIRCGGFQCGFCTAGMIMAAKALLDEQPNPTVEEIKHFMKGNICRCTGYQMIIESIQEASRLLGQPGKEA